MKSKRSTKPAKHTDEPGNFAAAALGLAVVCIAGLVMIVAARTSSDRSETPAMAQVQNTVTSIPARKAARPVKAVMTEAEPGPTTISGCLERDDDRFQLRDTDVVTEQKGRSWKSGFLKKGSASIEIIDDTDRLMLADHVGERISVTGRLEYREIHGRSLRRVAASCK